MSKALLTTFMATVLVGTSAAMAASMGPGKAPPPVPVAPVAAPADDGWVELGLLTCTGNGHSFVIGTTRDLTCRFEPVGNGAGATYDASVTRVGLDLSVTRSTEMVWGVFAPKFGARPDGLAGFYGGVSAEATLGAGIGTNALIGGFARSIVLNPVSLQNQTGLGVAAGVTGLKIAAK